MSTNVQKNIIGQKTGKLNKNFTGHKAICIHIQALISRLRNVVPPNGQYRNYRDHKSWRIIEHVFNLINLRSLHELNILYRYTSRKINPNNCSNKFVKAFIIK